MKAIKLFKQDFHTDMGGVFAAIKKVQSDVKECSGCIAEAEQQMVLWENQIIRKAGVDVIMHKYQAYLRR